MWPNVYRKSSERTFIHVRLEKQIPNNCYSLWLFFSSSFFRIKSLALSYNNRTDDGRKTFIFISLFIILWKRNAIFIHKLCAGHFGGSYGSEGKMLTQRKKMEKGNERRMNQMFLSERKDRFFSFFLFDNLLHFLQLQLMPRLIWTNDNEQTEWMNGWWRQKKNIMTSKWLK